MVHGRCLLLVEDDGTTREVLAALLDAEGWRVHAVETGEAALQWLQSQDSPPAVVLCDLNLPGVCGEPLARAFAEALSASAATCLIAMSATLKERVPGYAAGLLKPFPPAAVQQAWEEAVLEEERRSRKLPENSEDDLDGLPILSEDTLQQLQASMGRRAAQGLYAFALADTGDRLARMQRAVDEQDATTYVREAHAVKGSCGMLGARRLWRLASDAEMEGLAVMAHKKVLRLRVETEAVRLMLGTLFPMESEAQ